MIHQGQTQDSGAIQRIFEERARALARPLEAESAGEMVVLVVLALGAVRYGVDIHHVQEVQPLGRLTPVPGVPPRWAGLVSLRGRLYPVLDLYRHLGLPEAKPVAVGRIVLVSAAGLEVGLLVDDVPDVQPTSRAEIGPALTMAASAGRQFVTGVTKDLLSVLDLETLLADPALVVQEDVS